MGLDIQGKDGLPLKILAVEPSCDGPAIYAVFCSDMGLYHYDKMDKTLVLTAKIPNIKMPEPPKPNKDGIILPPPTFEIKLNCRYPYICVSERYGLNAAVVNVRDGTVRTFSRENPEARVTSYSIGFLEIYTPGEWVHKGSGRGHLIHQTKWNRLDITDLETGEVIAQHPAEAVEAADGFDYFHSLIHISPEQNYFLSNGWVWHPVNIISAYKMDDFLREGESSAYALDFQGGYNWDRPCAFISDDIFVIAADDKTTDLEEEEKAAYQYHQLLFYRLSDAKAPASLKSQYRGYLEPFKILDTDIFDINEHGEVKGKLFYDMDNYEDKGESSLIALSSRGAYVIDIEGKILRHISDITDEWGYHLEHHCFYHTSDTNVEKYLTSEETPSWKYDPAVCLIEERPLFVNFLELSLSTSRLFLKPLGCNYISLIELGMMLEHVVAIGGGVPYAYSENALQYLQHSLDDLNRKKSLRMAVLRKPDYALLGLVNLYHIDSGEYELDQNFCSRENTSGKEYEKEALKALLDWAAVNIPFTALRLGHRDDSVHAKAPPMDESKYTIINQSIGREGIHHSYKELTLPFLGHKVLVKAEIRTDVFNVFSDEVEPWCVSVYGWGDGYGDTQEKAFKDFYEEFSYWQKNLNVKKLGILIKNRKFVLSYSLYSVFLIY
ncbi:GNAT family N-acetyltransferase [Leadbettera azotonutricia]|uniref:Uncharacterized protein n=1 Tax=Leadbettera azotonutricia (strain ATCC BAA-888 / DSM 13862 / ZAS-9) TaxID=545695 RepID=F5YA56_LEAAZ|nr:GNAT family N-acetyltransferase [Leadbettera azotonutricia]AEF82435.1 hypothetical protein TREAZ_0777 [Leadbettera azotonutricia ZAS-9]